MGYFIQSAKIIPNFQINVQICKKISINICQIIKLHKIV